MRVLHVETYELEEKGQSDAYAILSHRWYKEEITLQSLNAARLRNKEEQSPQLNKIRGACARAKESGLRWVWIDACCINKDSITSCPGQSIPCSSGIRMLPSATPIYQTLLVQHLMPLYLSRKRLEGSSGGSIRNDSSAVGRCKSCLRQGR